MGVSSDDLLTVVMMIFEYVHNVSSSLDKNLTGKQMGNLCRLLGLMHYKAIKLSSSVDTQYLMQSLYLYASRIPLVG